MKDALSRLYRVIVEEIEQESCQDYTETELQALISQCAIDCKLTHRWLLHQSTRLKSRRRLELLVHEYQCSFVQLLDKVYYYQQQHPKHPLQPLYQALLKDLPKCLDRLQQRYRAYFQIDEKAPDMCVDILRHVFEPKWKGLSRSLKKLGADALLVQLVADSLYSSLKSEQGHFASFRNLNYVIEVTRTLEEWTAADYGDPTGELLLLLLSVNINTAAFVRYCIRYFSRLAEDASSPKDKRDRLCQYHHLVYRLPVRAGLAYDGAMPRASWLVDDWLVDEIRFLDGFCQERNSGKVISSSGESDNKLLTALTVYQLPVWAKGAIDAGLFPEENVEGLCRKLARIFRTRHQEQISPDSLQSKAYAASDRDKEIVNGYLIKMFNCIKRY